jgi:hypothetical protein
LKLWEAHSNTLQTVYTKIVEEEKIQIQASLDSWESTCLFSHNLIEETSKNCSVLWDSTVDIIEEYELPHVQFLGKSIPLLDCLSDI